MPEKQDSTRRWNGYVCPDCRFVFRVARDHDGRGVVCPSCRRLLKIPHASDPVPPLLAPAPKEEVVPAPDTPQAPTDPGAPAPPISRHRHRRVEKPEWEAKRGRRQVDDDEDETSGGGRGMAWMAGLSLVAFLGILLVIIFLKRGDPQAPQNGIPLSAANDTADKAVETPVRSYAEWMEEAQTVIGKFMEARTVEEVLEVVAHPEVVVDRIGPLHPEGTVDAPGLREIGHASQWVREGSHVTLPVQTRDFEVRFITLRDGPAGVKVDWESSVGWSEIPWERFGADEASMSGVFRVVMEPVEYYNFGFADEQKWQSFRLSSPDGAHSLHGYVERGSKLHLTLNSSLRDQSSVRVMLGLRHPDGGRGQAHIESKVADDWIDPERKNAP